MSDKPRHDHRSSLWIIVTLYGTALHWCYRCGAIRYHGKWTRPTGLDGENPAVVQMQREEKRKAR